MEIFGMEVPKAAIDIDFDELLGKKCIAVVGHREWQGKDREDVQTLKPFEGEDVDEEDEEPF
ncbi:MAG: hypothetical protein QMD71_06450 [bacterium]|nr:hypothetical protein [bacterium]